MAFGLKCSKWQLDIKIELCNISYWKENLEAVPEYPVDI